MRAASWKGWPRTTSLADKRTQQAVIMSLIIIGEAATKVMDGYAEFTQAHAEVPWRSMRNMRNRMAHGYFDINLDVVWETVQEWLPELLKQLPAVRQDRNASWENRDQREVLLDALPISRGFDDFVDHCVLVGMVHEQEPNDGMPFARSGAVSTARQTMLIGYAACLDAGSKP
jgi:uncharacterized protein with HEPN domain